MNIKKAKIDDLSIVLNITRETIERIYPKYYPKGAVVFFINHHNWENIKNDIDEGDVFILEVDSIVVGTVTIKNNNINRLFILPKYQGMGYGRLLIDFAEKSIEMNYKVIRIDASFPGKRIYLKRGYREIEYHSILTEIGDYLCYDVMEKRLVI